MKILATCSLCARLSRKDTSFMASRASLASAPGSTSKISRPPSRDTTTPSFDTSRNLAFALSN